MEHKQAIILAGINCGYFRAKSDEKKAEILAEMLQLEELEGVGEPAVFLVLKNETERRAAVYAARVRRSVEKAAAEESKPISAGADSAADHVQEMGPGVYVLTTAQNNTDVDKTAWGSLLTYCQARGAKLLAARTTYNKNGFQQPGELAEPLHYADEVKPFLVSGHLSLGGKVHFIADANVLPTAKNPLSGFAGVTPAGVSVVIPATKIALQCTARLKGGEGKILFSTGAITKRNYIMRKAGAVAATEHNIGALVVEVFGNGDFKARQLEIMPGARGFYDEGVFYSPEGGIPGECPAVLQFGDVHAEKLTPENTQRMFAQLRQYAPEHVILHDVCDFSSRNHHNVKDATFVYKQKILGNTVAKDIETVALVIDRVAHAAQRANESAEVHIVESNHDLAINTWLKNADFKTDPINALIYLELMAAWYRHITETPDDEFNMLEHACRVHGGLNCLGVTFHATDESLVIAGVEHGCHGHTGLNGAKGSPTSFRSLGVKMNTGHTHTPSICGPVYTAGVAGSLEMGYNVGPSSWQLANVLTWPNGQRQVIFM